MDRRYRDPDWLEEQYHENGLTQREIGDVCGVSPRAIRKHMKLFEIPTRELKGENHPLYGKERDEAVKKRISEKLKNREVSEETRRQISRSLRGNPIPPEIRKKISESLKGVSKSKETRRRMSEARLGEDVDSLDSDHWGEVAYGSGWKTAREAIIERDEVCQHCGADDSEHHLHVHHIVPLRMFRHSDILSFEDAHVDGNLILLCSQCHIHAEWGRIDVSPNFGSFPDEHRDEYQNLWEELHENPPRAFDRARASDEVEGSTRGERSG